MLAAGVAFCTQVGLWDIDHTSAGDDSSTYDGVLLFEPHRDYVSSLKWLGPSGSALLTGSYDGIVRQLDVETGVCVCVCVWWARGQWRGGRCSALCRCCAYTLESIRVQAQCNCDNTHFLHILPATMLLLLHVCRCVGHCWWCAARP